MPLQKWRVLSVICGQKSEGTSFAGVVEELQSHSVDHAEVLVLRNKTLQEVGEQILMWQPNIVYFTGADLGRQTAGAKLPVLTWRPADELAAGGGGGGGGGGQDEVAMLFQGLAVDTVYFDAPGCSRHAEMVQAMGVQNVIYWQIASVQATTAAHFGHAFFASLRDPFCTTLEAFAVAGQTTRAHCSTSYGEQSVPPAVPQLMSAGASSLPDMDSIPPPDIPGVQIAEDRVVGIPGWDDLRLLAPHAELRLLLCGQAGLLEPKRFSALGLSLRALLAQEVRSASLESMEPCPKTPGFLSAGSAAVRCSLKTWSGASLPVVLGGSAGVLERKEVVELALRHTLTADALSLQLRLPPLGSALPEARSVSHVALGCSVVETVAVLSVWAATLLRCLCQDPSARSLVVAGVAAVGGGPVAAFGPTDAAHFALLSPGQVRLVSAPAKRPSSVWEASHGGFDDEEEASRKRRRRQKSRLAPDDDSDAGGEAAPKLDIPYIPNRRSILECSEKEWMADYCSFASSQLGRHVTPATWPDAVLNGLPLDVFNLYKEVVQRGGFGMGNGINWKGQIFPKMKNYTPSNKMTGIGNALKTKYQQLLLDYEHAHPEDVTTDRCAICGGGEEVATDWVSCDRCQAWVHFSCDDRPGLGAFKDYAKTDGLSYLCHACSA